MVALGLVSVPPDPFMAGGCLVGCVLVGNGRTWGKRLNWRVSYLGASVLPLVVLSVCSGCSSVVPSASCVGGWSVSWGRVVLRSVVLLPLVWVGGVLYRIAPAAVSFVGVWSGCASCGRVWSGCGVWVSGVVTYCTRRKDYTFAPVFEL